MPLFKRTQSLTRAFLALAALGLLTATASVPAVAQMVTQGSVEKNKNSPSQMTEGVVQKIDHERSRITIQHGEIINLGMPPMTMVFLVRNDALLQKVQPGDAVKFTAIDEGGKLIVTDLQSTR